jgi:hypothetical protein
MTKSKENLFQASFSLKHTFPSFPYHIFLHHLLLERIDGFSFLPPFYSGDSDLSHHSKKATLLETTKEALLIFFDSFQMFFSFRFCDIVVFQLPFSLNVSLAIPSARP